MKHREEMAENFKVDGDYLRDITPGRRNFFGLKVSSMEKSFV